MMLYFIKSLLAKTGVTSAILSRDFVAQLYRATTSQVYDMPCRTLQLCRELINQRSPHFHDEVAQHRALRSCATNHVTLVILLRPITE